jgi:hypothetical protein
MSKLMKPFLSLLILIGATLTAMAQNQPNIPKPRGPLDMTETSNIVIFLVIPIIIVGFYFVFRKRIHNRRRP